MIEFPVFIISSKTVLKKYRIIKLLIPQLICPQVQSKNMFLYSQQMESEISLPTLVL